MERQIEIIDDTTIPEELLGVVRVGLEQLPESIKLALAEEADLNWYLESQAVYNEQSPLHAIFCRIVESLKEYQIICYHNTRLCHPESIIEKGLIFSREDYWNNLLQSMRENGIPEKEIEEVVPKIRHEMDRHGEMGENRRIDSVCYFNSPFLISKFDKFLAILGGEFIEFALSCEGKKYENLMRLGKPYTVKFALPYLELGEYQCKDIAKYIIKYAVEKYLCGCDDKIEYEGILFQEVKPEYIIELQETNCDLSDIYDYFFGEEI